MPDRPLCTECFALEGNINNEKTMLSFLRLLTYLNQLPKKPWVHLIRKYDCNRCVGPFKLSLVGCCLGLSSGRSQAIQHLERFAWYAGGGLMDYSAALMQNVWPWEHCIPSEWIYNATADHNVDVLLESYFWKRVQFNHHISFKLCIFTLYTLHSHQPSIVTVHSL